MKKFFKYLAYGLGAILLLVLLLIILLQFPFFQTKVAHYATDWLSEKVQSKISIDKIDINFLDRVTAKGIYIEDLEGDTLLYAADLKVNISLFGILKKDINLENIDLKNSVIHLKQDKDSVFNYQFIIDAFASEEDTTSSSYAIKVGKINLENIHASAKILSGDFQLNLKSTSLKMNNMDLDEMLFDIQKIHIDQLQVRAKLFDPIEDLPTPVLKDTIVQNIEFPLKDLGMKILVESVEISNSTIFYQNGTIAKGKYFNPNDIDLQALNLEIKNIQVDENKAQLEVENLSAQLNKEFQLEKLILDLFFDEHKASIKGLELLTDRSKGKADVSIEYASFAQLLNLEEVKNLNLLVDSLNLSLPELTYFLPMIDTMSSIQHLKNEIFYLDGSLDGTLENISIDHLFANIGQNKVQLKGNVLHVTNTDLMGLNDFEFSANTHISEIQPFLPKGTLKPSAKQLGKIQLSALLNGDMKKMIIQSLVLHTQGQLDAKMNGQVRNILNTDQLQYQLDFKHFTTGSKDLRAFMDSLPTQLLALNTATYSGKVSGDLYKYDVNGVLKSNIGDIDADILVKMNKDYSHAIYDGKINVADLDLQKILQNDSLGKLTAQIDIDGQGMTLEDLNAKVDLLVNDVTFNSYKYQNLSVKGQIESQVFEGNIASEDPNIFFNIDGTAHLNDTFPSAQVVGEISNLDLYALHLLPYPLKAKLKIDADIQGYNVDDILGYASIHDILLENDSLKWAADSIMFTAEILDNEQRQLLLTSPVLNASLLGQFNTTKLPVVFTKFGDQYFPFSSFIGGEEVDDAVSQAATDSIRKDYIKVEVGIKGPTDLAHLFQIDLRKLDTASLSFTLDAPENLSDLKFDMPFLQYGDMKVYEAKLTGDNQGNQLKTQLRIDSVRISDGLSIPTIEVDVKMNENKSSFSARIVEDSTNYRFGIQGNIDGTGKVIFLNIEEPLYLNFNEWNVVQAAPMSISKLDTIPEIKLVHDNQSLSIQGNMSQIKVDFNQFDINNILQLIKFDSTTFTGEINGDLAVGLEGNEAPINGDLKIDNIAINDINVGDIGLKADKNGDQVHAVLTLLGETNNMEVIGDYQMSDGTINANADINNIELAPFEIFVKSFAENLSGNISGDIAIKGTASEPQVNGVLNMDRVSAKVVELGSQYTVEKGSIKLSETSIDPNITLIDSTQNKATLTGSIQHKYFQDLQLDLNLDANNFTFLSSEKQSDALFYGKLVADANATIKGDLDLPVINVKVKTKPNTDFTVQLISNEAILNQERYIVFVDGFENFSKETIDSIAKINYKIPNTLDLTVNADITEDAILNVVIDPVTGDNLQVKGHAQLLVKLPPTGNLSMTGVYVVKEGNYRFSYQNILKKNFEIVPGGKITFSGDVMDALLDIKAQYNTQASTLPLLNNDVSALSDSEKDNVRKRAKVAVVLNASGRLSEPVLTFDVKLADQSSGPIGSNVIQALERIRMNESDLNKEVFSLLLFNSFTGSSSTGNIATAGTATALRSVGDLINSQLNKLAGNKEGLEINFGLDQYDDQVSEGGGQVTEVNLGVSQSLFNDKLEISVGGNVDLGSGNEERNGLSGVAGDFVLEYKVTDDGKYRIKVFQKSDYDVLNENNLWKTGVGFSYKTKFGKVIKNKNKKSKP
ncbi:MAG TPA: translocation/assembly module TamB domain-containing protein [Chitinophagales bacterium]|nr:translocation/assembly module TamB domain-containing protein [Chitinophagales bacterium]